MDIVGTPLSTFAFLLGFYTLAWIALWYVIEWRFRVLCQHNHHKIPANIAPLLSKSERQAILWVRLLLVSTLCGSAFVLYLLIL